MILVALETNCLPKYAERRRLAETTWATRMPAGYTFESFDGPRLGVDDTYKGLCEKTRAICRYAVAHDFDWLIVVDDDTYVRTEKLRIPEGDYAGFVGPENSFYCAGSFYWLSRRAFSILAEAPLLNWASAEDQWAGSTLREHGISPTRLPEVALEPCKCGRCDPYKVPHDWTAYTRWITFSPDLFKYFEKRYSSHL